MQNLQTQPQEMAAGALEAFAKSLCLALISGSITSIHLEGLLQSKSLPANLRNEVQTAKNAINTLSRKVLNSTITAGTQDWLRKELKKDKMYDIGTIIEMVSRIGAEGKDEVYEEFLSTVVDCLMVVFYAQENRKKPHFGKYRALFKLFTDELRADVNHTPGQVLFQNNKLYLRTQAEETPQQIKK